MIDVTQNDAINGLKFAVITSGARKADGNPHTAITAQALAIAQQRVDELAQIFFAWVSETRGISVDEVQALQAGISYGEKAVSLRLADSVSTLDQLVERLLAPSSEADSEMKASYKDAKKALESVLADANASEDEKASAKKMLAAVADDDEDKKDDDKDGKKSEADDGDKKDDDKKDSKADFGDDKKKDDDKKDDDKASAKAIADINARLDLAERNGEVRGILASRPDLSEAQVKAFKKLDPSALVAVLLATPINAKVEAKPTVVSPMGGALAAVKGEAKPTDTAPSAVYDKKRAEQRRKMGLAPAAVAAIRQVGTATVYDLAAKPESEV